MIKSNAIDRWKLKSKMANDFSINSRVEAKIHRILSETIIHDIKDPRLKNISINEVRLSPDLSNAKIFCSSLRTLSFESSKAETCKKMSFLVSSSVINP